MANEQFPSDMTYKINGQDMACLYGYGLFETVRIYQGRPFLLPQHMDRMMASARALGFVSVPDVDTVRQKIEAHRVAHRVTEGVFRVSLTYGNPGQDVSPDVYVTYRPVTYEEALYNTGIRMGVSAVRRNPSSLLVRHKTCNYLENILALAAAKKEGCRESLFLNTAEKVAEGAVSNVFFVKDKTLCTPSVSCGILPGITRSYVMHLARQAGILVQEDAYDLATICASDGCFITNAVMEIMPVAWIGADRIGHGKPHPMACELLALYRQDAFAVM